MGVNIVDSEKDLVIFLNELENKLEQVSEQLSELNLQKFKDKKSNPEIARLQKERAQLILNDSHQEIVARWQGEVSDPTLSRRLEVWADNMILAQVEAKDEIMDLTRKVGDAIVSHSYLVDGKRISLGEVRGIVRAHPDKSKREAAWRSYSELSNAIADDMLRLVMLRNEVANTLGYDSYVDLRLEKNGMATETVEGILTELTEATQERYDNLLEKGAVKLGINEIAPWDTQYILEQQGGVPTHYFPKAKLNEAIEAWANKMGFSLGDHGIKPLFIDIPYNGLCMGINRKKIRILSNPEDGYSYYKTLFHEMGHALHGALKTIDPYILRRESGIFTEGIAEIFGYIPGYYSWLKDFGMSDEIAKQALESAIGPQFHYLRQRTTFCLFEYQMYKDPDQNLHKLMAETEADILGGFADVTPRWAANAWYVNYPVYWQNYVLADVIASQIHHHLRDNIGSLVSDKAAFDYVVHNYIADGALVPWLDKIEKGTGEKLNAKAVIDDLTK